MGCCLECDDGKTHHEAKRGAGFMVVQQAEPSSADPLLVWGPMSAEVVSKSGHLVRVAAVEKALPMLLRRGSATLKHEADIVADFKDIIQIDEFRLPSQSVLDRSTRGVVREEDLRAMVREVTETYGGLPTGVIEVTPAIVRVFPRLAGLLGEPVPFLGSDVFPGDRFQEVVRQNVLDGKLDSYSIDAGIWKAEKQRRCDARGCFLVNDVQDLDLTGTTLCSSSEEQGGPGSAEARLPEAGFVIVQQARKGERLLQAGEDPVKGFVRVAGVLVGIEHPKGSTRKGKDWEREMQCDYGRIMSTNGADGDMIDAYVGSDLGSAWVYVVDQLQVSGSFDEHKVLLGFSSLGDAVKMYRAHYPESWRVGPVSTLAVEELHSWLKSGDHSAPVSVWFTTMQGAHENKVGGVGGNGQEAAGSVYGQQGTTSMAEAQKPQATPAPVKQADDPNRDGDETGVQVMRRLEACEQRLAELEARIGGMTQADKKPDEPDPTKEPDKTAQAGSPGAPAVVQQASPSIDDQVRQALAKHLPALVQQAIAAPNPTPTITPNLSAGAPAPAVREAHTPDPGAPPAIGAPQVKHADAVKRLQNGDPSGLRDVLESLT